MSELGLGRVKTFSCKTSELEEVATRVSVSSDREIDTAFEILAMNRQRISIRSHVPVAHP
jgi:hypothetical protein